ncbi:hypothetical protein GCM10017083_41630 [Thalassobaculum fulvum]|uniref:DUF983 domain-containing protein n=1 Tax=Thalassobaculum fulvum TaxID=1633335 RepID=A0A918XVW6_9PROT|nr:DUF983 domain-containing protein [Thalassobaculum fulvum]GHD58530.1 hypothetical protein GCM10017083_41630 [Thalassobaculum fulvum]
MTEPLMTVAEPEADRSVLQAVARGALGRCPACGEGRVLEGYLKATSGCSACGESYDHLRADDMPPWMTILIVGHIVVPLLLMVEQIWHPDMWLQMAVWPVVTLALLLLFLPRCKGAALGLLWATRAGQQEEPAESEPAS